MEPKFSMQYGEFAVADFLSKKVNGASVFIPASAQEKGIDLLLYKFVNGENIVKTVQVKMSRTYYNVTPKYKNTLWFYRFNVPDNADWFILVGIYAEYPDKAESAKVYEPQFREIMLAFKNNEIKEFMEEVRLKKSPDKYDKMFGFGFNSKDKIFQTRGYPTERDMSDYLIEKRINEIAKTFSR